MWGGWLRTLEPIDVLEERNTEIQELTK